ncbi:hypothetical protein P691DRAFT_636883, partial [Macrolepiota fuliginosa MF-IS2]
ILIFTDSISCAKCLFDYSTHSAHQDSTTIAPTIHKWLAQSPSNTLHFWSILSSAKWSTHHKSH